MDTVVTYQHTVPPEGAAQQSAPVAEAASTHGITSDGAVVDGSAENLFPPLPMDELMETAVVVGSGMLTIMAVFVIVVGTLLFLARLRHKQQERRYAGM